MAKPHTSAISWKGMSVSASREITCAFRCSVSQRCGVVFSSSLNRRPSVLTDMAHSRASSSTFFTLGRASATSSRKEQPRRCGRYFSTSCKSALPNIGGMPLRYSDSRSRRKRNSSPARRLQSTFRCGYSS